MQDLTDRFITGPKGHQPPALPMPTDEQLKRYDLDESKQEAFHYALENPLSVLMGPLALERLSSLAPCCTTS